MTLQDCERAILARRQQESRNNLPFPGNDPHPGDVYPLLIVRVWSDDSINGQIFLDGIDTMWVTSVHESDSLYGCWFWPEIVR
jgi:hypothetical protein